MGIISSYKIESKNLYLTERMSWTFEPNDQEAIQEWSLINVDDSNLDKKILDELISEGDNSEFDQQKIDNKIKVSIFSYSDHSEYFFKCDIISSRFRPLNIQELNDIIIHNKKYSEELDKTISKHRNTIEELTKFLNREIDRKNRIIEQLPDNSNTPAAKAKHHLESLLQIKNYLESNS